MGLGFELINLGQTPPEESPPPQEPAASSAQPESTEPMMDRREFLKKTLIGALGIAAARFYFPETAPQEAEAADQTPLEKPYSFEEVKKNCVENIRKNVSLQEELGAEKIGALCHFIESVDLDKINTCISEISGVPMEQLTKEKVISINVLSEKDWGELKMGPDDSGAMLYPNNIFSRARYLFDAQGEFDNSAAMGVTLHEYNHVLTCGDSHRTADHGVPWLEDYGLKRGFYEGASELQTLLLLKKIGISPPVNYGYRGGLTLSSFIASEIVGPENFGRDYYSGKIGTIQALFDKKLGQGSFEKNFKEGRELEFLIGDLEVLDAPYTMLKLLKARGFDYKEIIEKAKGLGIIENIKIIDEGDLDIQGLFDFCETRESKISLRGILESKKSISQYSPPLVVRFCPRGQNIKEFDYQRAVKNVAETIACLKSDVERYKEVLAPEELEEHIKNTNIFIYTHSINVVSVPGVADSVLQYNSSSDPNQKQEIKNKIVEQLKEAGRELIRELEKRCSEAI